MKTRLNKSHRMALRGHARDSISLPEQEAECAAAYEAAAALVKSCVEAKFPPKDMKMLKKYNVARHDECIRGACLDTARVVMFRFTEKAPMVPDDYCSSRSIAFDAETLAAVDAHEKSADALKAAKRSKLDDYVALIEASRTFEDVVEIWPGAEALREQITSRSTALVSLTPEVIARIKADQIAA